jgi:SAM-dependent methyltransferase
MLRDVWRSAESYEAYIGRWSRLVAREFVAELAIAPESIWLDVGCGSGALTSAIANAGNPAAVFALDRSFEFVEQSRSSLADARVRFLTGDAAHLPFERKGADVAVSGLVLNFVPEPERAVREMLEAVRPGGVVSTYLWDYSEGMQSIRFFWDAAIALDPNAANLDEAKRFPLCRPGPLEELFIAAGASEVRVSSVTVSMHFRDFDDLWSPFLGGQGPAPTYTMSLSERQRAALRGQLRSLVRPGADGSIDLSGKAWSVRGLAAH